MSNRPNILLITSDQQHHTALGSVNPHIQTPAFDRLATEGTRFDRAYCNNPVCSPSRATIITGQYPSWHGCWTIGVKLPEDVPTVGDVYQRNGYVTSLIGKAHFQPTVSTPDSPSIECQPTLRDLEFWRNFRGPWYGFRHVETARMHADEFHAGGHYGLWLEKRGLSNWRDYFKHYPLRDDEPQRQHKWELPQEYHYSTWTADRTIQYMRQHKLEGRPFYCWSSFHDPHPAYLVPEPWDTMYDPADMPMGRYVDGEFDDKPPHFAMTRDPNADWSAYQETPCYNHGMHYHVHDEALLRKNMAVYYGMTSFMDQQIGRILDALDDMDIADNTIVVFTSDHGHFLGQHGLTAKAAHLYEDLLRVPMLVRWPGQVPAGRTSDALQGLIDLPTTFLAAGGIDVPGQMQGVNQLDVWRGSAASARDDVIVEHRHQPTAVHMRSFVTDQYKLTVYRDKTYGELYDFADDPGEIVNRWDDPAYVEIKCELLRRFVNAELKREPTRMPRVAHA